MKGCSKSLPRGLDLQETSWDYFKVHFMDPDNLLLQPNELWQYTVHTNRSISIWGSAAEGSIVNTSRSFKSSRMSQQNWKSGATGTSVSSLMRQWGQNKHTLESSLTALHITQEHSWDQLRWDRIQLRRTSGFQKSTRLLRNRLGLMYVEHLVISQSIQVLTFPLPAD